MASTFTDSIEQPNNGIQIESFRLVDTAIDIQVERNRVIEAINARDAAIRRLSDAYESIRQKAVIIERLQQQETRNNSPFPFQAAPGAEKAEIARLRDEVLRLENVIKGLRDEIKLLKEPSPGLFKFPDPPPGYEEGGPKNLEGLQVVDRTQPFQIDPSRPPLRITSSPNPSHTSSHSSFSQVRSESRVSDHGGSTVTITSGEPADMVKARNAILAALPLPKDAPEDTLSPLSIPPTYTLQEFLSSMAGPLRTALANYRLFYALTTQWCPEREEHGYFYAPLFKCSTNPRVATAHRWSVVDVISRMNKPTECFFNKDGTWYYAGIYKAFIMDELTTKEWAELPPEAVQSIVKETISGRKNTSPQNVYETTQLYAAGALKVVCVGLQCVGFNNTMYRALLEQATKFAQNKWKTASPVPPATGGLGSGSIWNSNAGAQGLDIVESLGNMNLGQQNPDRNENVPVGKR